MSLVQKFLELYPSSRYADEIRMMYCKLNLLEEDYYDALRELGFLIDRTKSEDYKERAKGIGEKVAYNFKE